MVSVREHLKTIRERIDDYNESWEIEVLSTGVSEWNQRLNYDVPSGPVRQTSGNSPKFLSGYLPFGAAAQKC